MTPTKRKKVFISYSSIDQGLCDEFVEKFSSHHPNFDVLYDQKAYSGNFDKRFIGDYAQKCDIALLLINSAFIKSSYCNDEELPVLQDRELTDNLIIIPLLFQKCSFQKWNDEKGGRLTFFQIKNDEFKTTRREGTNSEKHNKQDVAYQEVGIDDREGYMFYLEKWIEQITEDKKDKREIVAYKGDSTHTLRTREQTEKILEIMNKHPKSNLFIIKVEETLSFKTEHWLKSNIPIPAPGQCYTYYYCSGFAKTLQVYSDQLETLMDDKNPDFLNLSASLDKLLVELRLKINCLKAVFDNGIDDKILQSIYDIEEELENAIAEVEEMAPNDVEKYKQISTINFSKLRSVLLQAKKGLKTIGTAALSSS